MSDNVGRKQAVSDELIQERIAKAVELKLEGFTNETVLKKLNDLSDKKGWGKISMRQLQRGFAQYHKENMVQGPERDEYLKCMRNIYLSRMQLIIENLLESIRTKPEEQWRPFEKIKAYKIAFGMEYDLYQLNFPKPNHKNLEIQFAKPATFTQAWEDTQKEFSKMQPQHKSELLKLIELEIERRKNIEEGGNVEIPNEGPSSDG